jgi:hypothetical protein
VDEGLWTSGVGGSTGDRAAVWRGAFDPLIRRQDDFASALARARSSGAGAAPSAEARAREAAEEFVSVALVQPILASLRNTNAAAPPFRPSRGERQFQALADAHVARQIVRSAHFPLVDRLARDLLRASPGTGPGAVSAPQSWPGPEIRA